MTRDIRVRNGRRRPELDTLEPRQMMDAGVTATLHAGVLTVAGTSASAPIVVDIHTAIARHRPVGAIFVEGVAAFKAGLVRTIAIKEVAGESVTVNRAPRWSPRVVVTVPTPISPPVAPPITLPPVVSITSTPPTPPPTTPTAPPSTSVSNETAAEFQIVAAVNIVRQMNGLAPLVLNAQLVQMGHIQANAMAQFQTMSHVLPQAAQPTLLDRANYVGYQFLSLGENIAYNFPDTGSVMAAWMNSPGHRANILDPSYTQIGVGIAYDVNGNPYYSQEFGQPMT